MLVRAWLTISLPFALAVLVLLIPARAAVWRGRVALAGPLAAIVLGLGFWEATDPTQAILLPGRWFSAPGISASLLIDRLGAFFVLLVGAVGLGVFQYAREYLGARANGRFWALMLAFTGAMLGIVLADNLLLLYVFWELTTVSSSLLVAAGSDGRDARRGAVQAFLVTAGGGLALLAGIVLLGEMAGTYELSALRARAPRIVADPAHVVPLALMLIGAFSKSAQVPFHFWLPGAMAAPAPVSAYLHSATMVKAGVFLIARLFPIASDSPLWVPLLATVGLTSFVIAGWNALWTDDVKKLLAYSTSAYLGLLVAHYGYSARVGLRGEMVNIANHALYKAALFLLVGWVEKATGTRDLRTLARERWPSRELVGVALFGLGALALAGSPLLLGFLSKELFLGAMAGAAVRGVAFQYVVVVVAAGLSAAYGLKIFAAMLFGSEVPPAARVPTKPVSPWLLVIPALLLTPQVLGGIAPALFVEPLMDPGVRLPPGPAVWHHVDVLLVISLASFGLGGLLYSVWRRLMRARHFPIADTVVSAMTGAALAAATWAGRAMQAGGHSRFGWWTFAAAVIAVVAAMPGHGRAVVWPDDWGPESLLGWAPGLLIAAAAILVIVMRRRLSKAIMLAVVGYGVAFYYVLFRAPDLVLTQVLVESVSLVLLLLVFRRMPPLGPDDRPAIVRVSHVGLAILVGVAMTLLTWSAASEPAPLRAGDRHMALSWPVAAGRNVVNVILVDFRGADTLGEIIVLLIAALGVVAVTRGSAASAGRSVSP